jgi:hypothetical protein
MLPSWRPHQRAKRAIVNTEAVAPERDRVPDLLPVFVPFHRISTIALHRVARSHESPAAPALVLCSRHGAVLLLKHVSQGLLARAHLRGTSIRAQVESCEGSDAQGGSAAQEERGAPALLP